MDKFVGDFLYRSNPGSSDQHSTLCCKQFLKLCGKKVEISKEGENLKVETEKFTFLCKEMKGEGKPTVECAQLKQNPSLYINIDENLRVYSPREIGSRESQEQICESRLIKLDTTGGPADTESMMGSEDLSSGGQKFHKAIHLSTGTNIRPSNIVTVKEIAANEASHRYQNPNPSTHSTTIIQNPSSDINSKPQFKPFLQSINESTKDVSSPANTKIDASHVLDIIKEYSKFSRDHPTQIPRKLSQHLKKSINKLRKSHFL